MKLKQKLIWFFRKRFKDYKLSTKMKKRSVRKYKKLKRKFIKKNKREPKRTEIGFLIIRASHLACRLRGKRGHWVRQKIREYLFNMHGLEFKKR
jgi:hypothetical protein